MPSLKNQWYTGKDTLRQAVENQVQRYTPKMVAEHFECIEVWIASQSDCVSKERA